MHFNGTDTETFIGADVRMHVRVAVRDVKAGASVGRSTEKEEDIDGTHTNKLKGD